jgi:putative transposase
MARRSRLTRGGYVYHVLNRSAKSAKLFEAREDYELFEDLLIEARLKFSMRTIAYCAMPTHWHLLLWPSQDRELSNHAKWLEGTHASRWHKTRGSTGRGAVYQGRFKSIPIETGRHFYWVWRYVERNPLRAKLVVEADQWRWSSLWWRVNDPNHAPFDEGPAPLPSDWKEWITVPQTERELETFRDRAEKGLAFGSETWCESQFAPLRKRGRPFTKIEKMGSDPI